MVVGQSCYNESQVASPAPSRPTTPVADPIVSETPGFNCSTDRASLAAGLKGRFNSVGIDDDQTRAANDTDRSSIETLRSCSAASLKQTIEKLRAQNMDNLELQAKASYLLIKLRHDRVKNGSILTSTYIAKHKEILARYKDPNYSVNVENNRYDDSFSEDGILALIYDVVSNDDAQIIVVAFDLVSYTDGDTAELLSGLFAEQFVKEPELFLQRLKTKPPRVQKQVCQFVAWGDRKDVLERALARVPKNSDVFEITRHLRRAIQDVEKVNE